MVMEVAPPITNSNSSDEVGRKFDTERDAVEVPDSINNMEQPGESPTDKMANNAGSQAQFDETAKGDIKGWDQTFGEQEPAKTN